MKKYGIKILRYLFFCSLSVAFMSLAFPTRPKQRLIMPEDITAIDTPRTDTAKPKSSTPLKYKFKDNSYSSDPADKKEGGLKLNEPSNIKSTIEYDPETGKYNYIQKIGDRNYRPPTELEAEDYEDYEFKKAVRNYWKQRISAESPNKIKPLIPTLHVGGQLFTSLFGSGSVDIRPQGTAELIFAANTSRTENPAMPEKQRKMTTFDFNMKIQLNVIGKIGEKLKLTSTYNTEATFDFENQMKLEYTGFEDEIIKKIEAGNVSLPLTGSLITGSQSLFGVKTQLQFGRLTATTIFSQQKGKKSEIEVTGGAQTSKFTIDGDSYEANRHYFLGHFFRDQYNKALATLPVVISDVQLTRVEVWVTNKNSSVENTRNIVAFSDLGEDTAHVNAIHKNTNIIDDPAMIVPYNAANSLYDQLVKPGTGVISSRDFSKINAELALTPYIGVRDYEKLENARKLLPSEYTFNSRLGFISLNQGGLNYDEVLAVAFEYSYNNVLYQVGEFSGDGTTGSQPLIVKLLKSTNVSTSYPMWDLMMKNIYSIGAYQVNPKDFKLDIWYNNNGVDIPYLTEGVIKNKPLIQVMNLDVLNGQSERKPDGVFDFIEGATIYSSNGRIIFPVLEPFGSHLRSQFSANEQTLANKYIFQELYDSTRTVAQQFPTKNKFKIKGTYQSSSSSEISLNAPNIPQGSVSVTAAGAQLSENVDYTVDYALGRVKIINEGILNSGAPIKVSLESNSLFSIQSKTLLGTHLDYRISKDFTLGGTILNLTERPLTQKINIGDEPISNTIWGLDGNYRTEAPFLTRMVDKIPLLQTKEMSTISVGGEFANLIPGHAKAIGKDGNSYIDDFEGSQAAIDIKSVGSWFLASTPQGQPSLFPEASNDSLSYGFNRAKLAWYVVDPLLIRDPGVKDLPSGINATSMSSNSSREVLETEIFPNKQAPNGQPINIPVLDLTYFPSERGPYNFDVKPTGFSAGVDPNTGALLNPESRWGGIMRRIETNDFESANIEFLQFWVMDPYNTDNTNPGTTGDLYFNLGNISEDVLKDSRKSFENGLPNSENSTTPYDVTPWGRVPTVQSVVNAFDNNQSAREFQDVGLDGLRDADELKHYQKFLSEMSQFSPNGYNMVKDDPSSDDYAHFRDGSSSVIVDRYKNVNGTDGNSPVAQSGEQFSRSSTTIPNTEDINRDNTMSENESYYQYKISLRPQDLQTVGSNFITDIYEASVDPKDPNMSNKMVKWYQFKVPVKSYESKIGSIEDFKSIRFVRMYMKGVDKPIVLRFARLELIRGDWRKYNYDLLTPGLYITNDNSNTLFNVAAVNIEENGNRKPVNYVLPPDIEREVNQQTTNQAQLNEQALSIKVCNLEDGKARAVYKNADLDVRSYKKLKMYIHAEAGSNTEPLNSKDLQCFVRLGTDYTDNYYEYVIPLEVTPEGNYSNTNTDDRARVWPSANNLELNFSSLQQAKQRRNSDMVGNSGVTLLTEYLTYDSDNPQNKIIIRGNPNLSSIKTIMIGIRNPKVQSGAGDNDDGLPKCGEIWINELRLSDFDEKGGWASMARVSAKLADFGNITLAGNWSTPGFGSIEKKVNERQRETIRGYDASGSFELGKFLPENFNIHVPMYVGMAQAKSTPKYNPLDPDIEMKNVIKDPEMSSAFKDSILQITEDYTERKSINFTNVKKEKGKNAGKAHFYDVENVAVSYAYTELSRRNINIEYNNTRTYRGSLSYNYNATPKNYRPFGNTKLFSSKYLALIKDFNYYLAPNRLGFTTDLDRNFSEFKNRDLTGYGSTAPTYNKSFTWQRLYDLRYDITKTLKLDFSANNDSRILEPDGKIDTEQKRDTIKSNLKGMGKTMFYSHNTNINYTPPINKIPMLDFASGSVRYSSGYKWDRGPLSADSLGHAISNTNAIQWNAQFNMITLYNKVPFLKKINQKKPGAKPPAPVKPLVKSPGSDTVKTKKPEKDAGDFILYEYLLRTVMTLRTASVSFTENNGTVMPGYGKSTQIMGLDPRFEGPGVGFILGQQKKFGPDKTYDFAEYAGNNGWLIKSNSLNTPYMRTNNRSYNARASAEPFPDLKIELSANKSHTRNNTSYYKWDNLQNKYIAETPVESGNFTISFISWKTAFKKEDKENHTSEVFQKFLDSRATISSRLGQKSGVSAPLSSGYWDGFNENSQEVLIPAFLAAYSGKNPNSSSLNTFPRLPLPNWRITYDGFSKIDFFKKYFRTFTLSHSYRSTYNVGAYTTNLRFEDPDNDGFTTIRELNSSANANYLSQRSISTISISEQFSPLAKVEMAWNNSLLTNVEFKKDRTLSLGLTGKQLMEIYGKEIVVGAGYRIQELTLPIKIGKKKLKSDLNLKADVSIRSNKMAERKIVENISRLTSGQTIITIKVSADYVINDKLNLRLFYDRIITKPSTSLSFPTSNTNAGVSLRFTLSQ